MPDLALQLVEPETETQRLRRQVAELKLRVAFLERDALTELLGRHMLERLLPTEFARAERNRRPLSVIALDVDFFKRVNDTHGHSAGDAVLQGVAQSIKAAVRASDLVFRPHGEEFVVVLAETTVDEAELVAARILSEVRTRTGVTVSAGVSCYPDHGQSPKSLLAAADTALYASKHGGRDRVTSAWLKESSGAA